MAWTLRSPRTFKFNFLQRGFLLRSLWQGVTPGAKSRYSSKAPHHVPWSLTTSQIFGNYVDGVAIAGLVQVSQLLATSNGGIVKSLGFDGKITLESGQIVRINDPNAVYSAGYTARPDFTADDQNPSISGEALAPVSFTILVPTTDYSCHQPSVASQCAFQDQRMILNVRHRTDLLARLSSPHPTL